MHNLLAIFLNTTDTVLNHFSQDLLLKALVYKLNTLKRRHQYSTLYQPLCSVNNFLASSGEDWHRTAEMKAVAVS